MTIWRRIRGLLGTALSWAMLWLTIGASLAVYDGDLAALGFRFVAWFAGFFGVCGAVGGGVFALLLAAAERSRSVDELSKFRVTMWGLFGGLAIPGLFAIVLNRVLPIQLDMSVLSFAITAALGAGSAAGTLALARRAPHQLPPKSSDAGSLTRA